MYASYELPVTAAFPHFLQIPQTFEIPGHILLVEDNPLLQIIHKQLLEELDYCVTVASSGEEALITANDQFDLVLMDIDLPGMNGFVTSEALLQRLSVPVIACTTHLAKDVKEKCFQSGMVDYLHKPVTPKELEQCLKKHMYKKGYARKNLF